MSSRDPLWYCHQCHAEMRPLMTPDPVCAFCHGTFVEKLENPADDPRIFQNRPANTFDIPTSIPGAFSSDDLPFRPRSPPTQRIQDNPPTSSGYGFEFHTGPGGARTRTFIIGGPSTLRRSPPSPPVSDDALSSILEFLRRPDSPTNNRPTGPNGDITGPLMAQYLLAMFGREPHARGDPFAELLGMPQSTQWGDYVFNQEALDQILSQLADNATGGRPVPATEEIISNLPREVLTQGSPLLERDCAICKESFGLDPEDPDELVVVTLPCKHPFHQGCILPWLKSSGTCPVCRHALIAQRQQHPPGGSSGGTSGGPSGGSSSSSRPNPPSGSRPNPSGNSDRSGPGNIFQALFGRGSGGSSSNSDTHSTRSRRNFGRANRNAYPEVVSHSTPSFPGQWIEDID